MDLYQQVTDRIIAELENGAAPWVKSWKTGGVGLGMDRNLVSGKSYRGINRLLLAMAGFSSPLWATYKQWSEKGYQVAKGSKGTHIVFFKPVTGKRNTETGEIENGYAIMRGYVVFNASQTDYVAPQVDGGAEFEPMAACEDFIGATGAQVNHGGDAAFYVPSQDRIQMPAKTAFDTEGHYYSTAFHELTHWTGAANRLDRKFGERFGNPEYAFEELVAELGAAFLCADFGIDGELRHAGYIEHWLRACKADNKAIFKAAAYAQKAADYLNATQDAEQQEAA
jgi:antirestriction protein ArdC